MTVSKITEKKSSLTKEQMNSINNLRKNSKLDLKDLNSAISGSYPAIRSFGSEPRQNDLLASPKVDTALFNNQGRKSRDNAIDDLMIPMMDPVSSRIGHANVEEARSSLVNIIRRNSVVDVMKHSPQKEFEESTQEELNNETESIEEVIDNQDRDQNDIMNKSHIQTPVLKKKKKKIKKIESDKIDGETQKSSKKKKKLLKKKETDESLSKEESEQQSDNKAKKTKKVKKSEILETV